MVPIGNYVGSNSAVCRANIDKLFGHHFAILGSTGSGKSGTVASILHSILDYEHEQNKLKPRSFKPFFLFPTSISLPFSKYFFRS